MSGKLGAGAGVILLLRLIGLWRHAGPRFRVALKIPAALLLAATLAAAGSAGWKIIHAPKLWQKEDNGH